ncbi:DsrE family protein [Speluncibacter jeojiensis]|uniref:DsrE family protein n=1 Tax=Speluncibacter jeojiensis TaxID=2710754 RepID=A0A9X4RD88_9ACTN|nr:DsrE family protein [Corynebacteriales bacterium D3-21]
MSVNRDTVDDGVVVHLPEADPKRQETVLRNVANLLRALGPDTVVELVTHGPGVELCTGETGLADTVADLQQRGVTVCACANTVAARQLAESDLLPGVTVVPSGIAHLVVRQRQGWSYLRP